MVPSTTTSAVSLHTCPLQAADRFWIVVARYEVFSSIQLRQDQLSELEPRSKIAEVPNVIFCSYTSIPPCDQRLVHLIQRVERARSDV